MVLVADDRRGRLKRVPMFCGFTITPCRVTIHPLSGCRISVCKTMPHITTHDKIFELQEDETLLEGLERTGHDVEYQCRNGYCGSCRVKILAGRVEYDHFPLAFVAPGEILPCCCRVAEDITLDCRSRMAEPDLFDVGLFDGESG